MLSRKIRIDSFISDEEKEEICQYSKSLSDIYNECLDLLRENLNFKDLSKIIKGKSKTTGLYSKHIQNTSREVINAVKSYLAKKKNDKSARFPKLYREYSSIIMDINLSTKTVEVVNSEIGEVTLEKKYYPGGGFKLEGKKINFTSIGFELDLSKCSYYDTELINYETLKQIVIKIDENKRIDCIFVFSEKKQEKELNKNFLSIDLGVSSIASCYSNKIDCLKIQTKRFKGLERTIDELKSKRDKKKKGSRAYKKLNKTIKRKQTKLTNKRKDYLHKTSKTIVDLCILNDIDNIICGDIKTKKLKKDYKTKLNKSTQNEGLLSRFKGFLKYKAENKGLNFLLVNEAYTSQTNCLTGERELSSNLSIREVELSPGFIVDRDINSAVNIAKICGDLWLSHIFERNRLLKIQKMNITL